MSSRLTLQELQKAVTYSEEDKTFVFIWNTRDIDKSGFNTMFAGKKAGCKTAQEYVHLSVNRHMHKLHRLVYMLHNEIPSIEEVPTSIDHINRDKTDNRISNLRDGSSGSTYNTNGRNRQQMGESGYIGVVLSDRLRGKYGATIGVAYYEVVLCTYKEESVAAEYYKAACAYLGYEIADCYSEVKDIILPTEVIQRIKDKMSENPLEHKTSPYDGITWSKQKKKWVSRLHHYSSGGNISKNLHLGYYTDDKEGSIRRDLEIIENGYSNPLITISEDEYKYYRDKYPVRTYKKVKVTDKKTGEVRYFNGVTRIADKLHMDKRVVSAILGERRANIYTVDFEWVFLTKEQMEGMEIN